MANLQRFFNLGKMNKVVDERFVPNGDYIDAMNIRMGSTENDEIGVLTNTLGNSKLTSLNFLGTPLSADARCIGAFDDGAFETIYWCVHDPSFTSSPTGKLDLVVSYNANNAVTTYHVISMWNGEGIAAQGNTTLNFDPAYLITGIDKIEDLFFFTDGNAQPRQINVKRDYPQPVSGTDGFTEQDILVVKKPPINAPVIVPLTTGGDSEFLVERFICFAYRYRYEDNQYSATSQWSDPSFIPNPFSFSIASNLNEGMVNRTNSVEVTFNSGSSSVVGVDILFKEMGNSIIKVIEKLDKGILGYADDTDYTYTFTNSKIFSVLPSSEILRLYDNVPLTAEAQTIMGNRVMYGNYTEGGDMVDLNGYPTKLEYVVDLISSDINSETIGDSTTSSAYTFGNSNSYPDTVVSFDLTDLEGSLLAGSIIEFTITLRSSQFFLDGNPSPDSETESITIDLIFALQVDYDSVYDMATSPEFLERIGTLGNILPVDDACNGITLTDLFNCQIPNSLGTAPDEYFKYQSGISAANQPINVIAIDGDGFIKLQLPAMRFVDDVDTPTISIYEYYKITSASGRFVGTGNPKSLHSNRGYEIGISYMDEYNRMSTALVSENNNVFVPCSASDTQNKIQVTIPTSQVAPAWAKRYKFFIKPDKGDYETIYSRAYYDDPIENTTWFLLEGENAAKVEKGARYIVKSDSSGALETCNYVTVLEKEALGAGVADESAAGLGNGSAPAGAYMKLNTFNFSTSQIENQNIFFGSKTVTENDDGDCPNMSYGLSLWNPDLEQWYDYTIPQGSVINFYVRMIRKGIGDGENPACRRREYIFDKEFTASADYDSIEEWFYGDNFAAAVNSGVSYVGGSDASIDNIFANTTAASQPSNCALSTNYWQLYRDGDGQLLLSITGTKACGSSNKKESKVIASIAVFRTGGIMVFETEALDAAPDIWFESDQVFGINDSGEHMGNVQDQDILGNIPAIIDTSFFNCWAFGNGVESYKIRDSIIGKSISLGNRVSSTQERDYELSERFADITYSGIYNEESNVNKLNEFNLGLLNFKNLEIAFGPIRKMFGRRKDVMVLQEDRISYVLSGANILSDLSAGNLLTSVPDVLGDQFVRVEEYGISNNPESFVEWGGMKYFTDAKRGAVIQLRGGAEGQDQLTVISEAGMRTWFRDLFIDSFNTQKLGGYDPYMDEYVLSSNSILRPSDEECVSCGVVMTFNVSPSNPISFCTDFSGIVGDVQVRWQVLSGDQLFEIVTTYNSIPNSSGPANGNGNFTFDKDSVSVNQATTTITSIGDGDGNVVQIQVACPQAQVITIYEVCLTSVVDAGKFIHNEYRWTDGAFVSPLHSSMVELQDSDDLIIISQYNLITGSQGAGIIPSDTATVRMYFNKFSFDDLVFDINENKFRYVRSNTVYGETEAEMTALLGASAEATPIVDTSAPSLYYADFPMPITGESNLYMIWDYRKDVIPPPFIFTIQTDVAEQDFMLPMKVLNSSYDFTVDWGDGSSEAVSGYSIVTHTYDEAGEYIIVISGTFQGIAFANNIYAPMLKSIDQWGILETGTSLGGAFYGCSNMVSNAVDTLSTVGVVNFASAFEGCNSLVDIYGIGSWDTSLCTSFLNTFNSCWVFNTNILQWDTSEALSMESMFQSAFAFNGDVTGFNTAKVTNMQEMFTAAFVFNQHLTTVGGIWDVSKVTNFTRMFKDARLFNGNLSSWVTTEAVSMDFMFSVAGEDLIPSGYNQPVGNFDMTNVTTITSMFLGCGAFNQDLDTWNITSALTSAGEAFRSTSFNGSVAGWDVSGLQIANSMFQNAELGASNGLDTWVTSSLQNMARMFMDCADFNNDISGWDVSNVTTLSLTFRGCNAFAANLSTWTTGALTSVNETFRSCISFNSSVNGFDVSLCPSFNMTFDGCAVFNQSMNWDTSSGTDFRDMFNNCDALKQNLSWIDVASATQMNAFLTSTDINDPSSASSTANYDSLLGTIAGQIPLQSGVTLDMGSAKFSAGTGLALRNSILAEGWTINDGGQF